MILRLGGEYDGVQCKVAVWLKSRIQGKHMKPHFISTSCLALMFKDYTVFSVSIVTSYHLKNDCRLVYILLQGLVNI